MAGFTVAITYNDIYQTWHITCSATHYFSHEIFVQTVVLNDCLNLKFFVSHNKQIYKMNNFLQAGRIFLPTTTPCRSAAQGGDLLAKPRKRVWRIENYFTSNVPIIEVFSSSIEIS